MLRCRSDDFNELEGTYHERGLKDRAISAFGQLPTFADGLDTGGEAGRTHPKNWPGIAGSRRDRVNRVRLFGEQLGDTLALFRAWPRHELRPCGTEGLWTDRKRP